MKTIYITEEQKNEIKRAELLSEKKVPTAQDQVHNKVNAGIMDTVTACGSMEEGAEPGGPDVFMLGPEKSMDLNPYYHVNEEKENESFKKYFNEIAEFMEKNGLKVSPFPKINLDWSEQDGLFIRTGFYSPEEKEITVFCKDRHPKDILRTFAHEMIHHSQNLRGVNLSFSSADDVKDNKELEKIEAEAYLKGNIYFRKWTEYENTEKQPLNESALDVEYHYTTIENLKGILDNECFKLNKSINDAPNRKKAFFMSLSRIRSCKEGYGLYMNRTKRPLVRIELNGNALNNIRYANISSFDFWYNVDGTPARKFGDQRAEAEDSLNYDKEYIMSPDMDIFKVINRIDILFCPFYTYQQYKQARDFVYWALVEDYECIQLWKDKIHFYINEKNFNNKQKDDFTLEDLWRSGPSNYIFNEVGLRETIWALCDEENGFLFLEGLTNLDGLEHYTNLVKINLSKLKIREKPLKFSNEKRLNSFLVKNGYDGYFTDNEGFYLVLFNNKDYFSNGIIQYFKPNLKPNMYENSEKKSLNESKTILNDEGEVVPNKCTCGGKIGTYICGEPVYKCTKCGKYYGTVKFGLDESKVFDETNPEDVDLSSFNIKRELNPKFWKNNLLDSRIRLKLLDIAEDFIDFLGVDWVKPDDIIITGSLANFNWNKKYSDIDLHVLMDFSKIDKRTDFVKKYFDSLKNQWNEEHENLKIFGFPVEVYVQDTNESHASSGVYSLDQNKWLTEPKREKLASAKVNKSFIRSKVAKYIDDIENLINDYKSEKNDSHKTEKIYAKANKLWDDIKNERKKELNNGKSEISNGNIIFKCLRRLNYLDKLYDLKSKAYDNINSLNEISMQSAVTDKSMFDKVYTFKDGFAKVVYHDKWNFVNTKFQLISPELWFDYETNFMNGFARVALYDEEGNLKCNFIKPNGELLTKYLWYDDASNFSEGFTCIRVGQKWSYIDTQGRFLFDDLWFDNAGPFLRGIATVTLNNKRFKIDKYGSVYKPDKNLIYHNRTEQEIEKQENYEALLGNIKNFYEKNRDKTLTAIWFNVDYKTVEKAINGNW